MTINSPQTGELPVPLPATQPVCHRHAPRTAFSRHDAHLQSKIIAGQPLHGKDYAVMGDPTSDMRSYSKVDGRTLKRTVKKDGRVTATGRVVVCADGKSRMVTTSGTDVEGKKSKTW
jgi:hypothetical protein